MKKISFSIIGLIIFYTGLIHTGYPQDRKAEIKKLSRDSDVILSGKVLKKNSSWNKERTRIFTNVTVEVEEYIKGHGMNKNILVTHPGGEIGEVGEWYSHTPTFEDGEEVLLFLQKDSKNNFYRVMNGEDGKLTLHSDRNTGEKMTSAQIGISELKKEINNELK